LFIAIAVDGAVDDEAIADGEISFFRVTMSSSPG
jgi:hypothetical protein